MKISLVFTITAVFLSTAVFAADAPPDDLPRTLGEPPLPVRGCIDDFGSDRMQFSPDGRRLLLDNSRKSCVWDVETFKQVNPAFPADWRADESTYVAEGSLVLVTDRDRGPSRRARAQYFDAATAKPVGPIFHSKGQNGDFVSSGDGRYLAVWCSKNTPGFTEEIRVLECATSRVVFSKTFERTLRDVRLNQDGSVLLYCENAAGRYEEDPPTILVRVRTGKRMLARETLPTNSDAVVFSADGKLVLIPDAKVPRVFDLATQIMIAEFPPRQVRPGEAAPEISDATLSDDGTQVLFWRDGALCRWRLGTAEISPPLLKLGTGDFPIAIARDHQRMLCRYGTKPNNVNDYEGIAVIDAAGRRIWKWRCDSPQPLPEISFSNDGRRIAISYRMRNRTYVLDLNDLPETGAAATRRTSAPSPVIAARRPPTSIGRPRLPIRGRIDEFYRRGVRFSPNQHALLANNESRIQIIDAATLKPIGAGLDAKWDNDNPSFVAGSSMVFATINDAGASDGTSSAQYFDVSSGRPVGAAFKMLKDGGWAVSSGDGRFFAVTYGPNGPGGFPPTTEMRVIERSTSKVVFSKTFDGVLAFLGRLSRDGRFLIYQESHSTAVMRVVRVADGTFLFADQLKPRNIAWEEAVNFSPDGKSVVIGDYNSFKVFDLATEKLLFTSPEFQPSEDDKEETLPFRRASFSDDGSCVFYWQGPILRRWSFLTGQFLPAFPWKGKLSNISMSRDGRRMGCNYETNDAGPDDEGTGIFDLDTGKALWKWSRSRRWGAVALSGDGKHAVVDDSVQNCEYMLDLNDLTLSPMTQPTTAPTAK